jgi:hypothetical protein
MRTTTFLCLIAAMLATPPGASGQLAWDTPRLLGPDSPEGLGLHWVRAGTLPGDGDVFMMTWAFPGLPPGVTLRGGAGQGAEGEVAGFGGVDVRTSLVQHTEDQPLDVAWVVGAGLGIGRYALFTVPIGVSAGRPWSSGSVWIAPHVAMGVALDLHLGSEAPAEEFQASPFAEVGADLALDSARRLVLRTGVSLGDRQAVGVGLVIRTRG